MRKWTILLCLVMFEGCPLTVNVEQMDVYVTPEVAEMLMESVKNDD